jgi:hypothetical protein
MKRNGNQEERSTESISENLSHTDINAENSYLRHCNPASC